VVKAYDPQAMDKAAPLVPLVRLPERRVQCAEGSDAVLLLTEWTDFKSLPWQAMKKTMLSPLLFDGRNLLDPEEMRGLGYTYVSVGR